MSPAALRPVRTMPHAAPDAAPLRRAACALRDAATLAAAWLIVAAFDWTTRADDPEHVGLWRGLAHDLVHDLAEAWGDDLASHPWLAAASALLLAALVMLASHLAALAGWLGWGVPC